jgi:uncharacterized membrane protein
MLITAHSPEESAVRIMARGNFSLAPGGLVNLLLALSAVTLGLAGVLAWQGYWPILLIAILQVVLVGWILVRAWQNAWVSEVVEIGPERIRVTRRRYARVSEFELETAWAVTELRRPEVAWYATGVVLRSRSQTLELGRFLTEAERLRYADLLRKAIRKYSAIGRRT